MPRLAFFSNVILVLAIVVLLGKAASFYRDYQDSWILEGLEIPFLFFVVVYAVTYFSEKKMSTMILLAVMARIVFLLIPNLKYVWFQGVYSDQQTQFALANYVYSAGHISPIGSPAYIVTPLMHLMFSVFSVVSKISVVDSIKYLPVLFSPIYPLVTYTLVKKMGFSEEKSILRYALFISSIPFTMEQFTITGTLFGILLAFLILSCMTTILGKNDRRYWPVLIVLVFALAASHSVTSLMLATFVLIIMAIQRIPFFQLRTRLRASIAIATATISMAWLMFPANFTLGIVLRLVLTAITGGPASATESIPPTFFDLARVDLMGAVQTFLVYYGADLFLLLLTSAGVVTLMFRLRKKSNDTAKFVVLFGGLAIILILFGVLAKLGPTRTLHFAELLFPIFSGFSVFYLGRKMSWLRPIIFATIVLLAVFELYGCQPLIPSANVLYRDLPTDVPIANVNGVNSIYQRQMITFVHDHVSGRIASDAQTGNQLTGLAGYDFSIAHLLGYNPLDNRQPRQQYDYFMIHYPGKSGTLGESAEMRSPNLILETVRSSSIIYTDGESYVLGAVP